MRTKYYYNGILIQRVHNWKKWVWRAVGISPLPYDTPEEAEEAIDRKALMCMLTEHPIVSM